MNLGFRSNLSLPLWLAAALLLPSAALAEKDRFEVGEEVPIFTLKSVNPEDFGGDPYIGVDRYFGPEATDPKSGILISFFATYCEPCKKEMPFLAALQEEYREKGLQVLSISIDKEPEKIEFIKELAQKSGVKFPVLSDHFNIVAKRYLVEKLPCVYLLDKDGKVTMVQIGYSGDVSQHMLAEVRKVVGEPTSAPVPAGLQRFMDHDGAAPSAHAESAAAPAEGAEAAAASEKGAEQAVVADDAKKKKKKRRKKRRKRRRRRRAK